MAHTVVLSWTASTDVVDGYNVYRGPAGAETLLASGVTGTTYTDSSPLQVTDYIVRSVRGGVESVNSNEISVSLPAPAAPTGLSGVAH